MKTIDWKLFEKPDKTYRAKPLGALNGKLEKRHLKYQIECMKQMGFGGAFLHSRTGLETDFVVADGNLSIETVFTRNNMFGCSDEKMKS